MPRKEILDRIQKYVDPFRITKGKGFRLKDFDPGDTCGLKLDKGEAAELLSAALRGSRRSRTCSTPRIAGPAARLPGDGRGRQGRHDQARHVGRQPAGLPGLLLQGALGRGARPRLPVALRQAPARARPDRHLQPLVLRGGARRARAPRDPEAAEAARRRSSSKRIWDERLDDIAHFEDYLTRNGTSS